MKWLKGMLLIIGILGVICLGGYIVYNVAYAIGETTGYDRGYSAGERVGYSLGKQEGYDAGKTDGYSSGRQEGYDEGYSSGRADGYDEGYEVGVEAGLGHGYTLSDPTYKQVVAFLREDRTDKNKYVEDTYTCINFAMDVNNNAEAQGLRSAYVVIKFQEQGHTIIAFDTVDKGLLFFEPQFDDEVKIVINRSFSQLNNYQKPTFDDTIRDILVIW